MVLPFCTVPCRVFRMCSCISAQVLGFDVHALFLTIDLQDADFVVLDFAVNDGHTSPPGRDKYGYSFPGATRRGFEQLVRRGGDVLGLAGWPGVPASIFSLSLHLQLPKQCGLLCVLLWLSAGPQEPEAAGVASRCNAALFFVERHS